MRKENKKMFYAISTVNANEKVKIRLEGFIGDTSNTSVTIYFDDDDLMDFNSGRFHIRYHYNINKDIGEVRRRIMSVIGSTDLEVTKDADRFIHDYKYRIRDRVLVTEDFHSVMKRKVEDFVKCIE